MKDRWEATLEGGPFDGDEGEIDFTPPTLWVIQEEKESAWFSDKVKGSEVYLRHRQNDERHTVAYVYKDLILNPAWKWVSEVHA